MVRAFLGYVLCLATVSAIFAKDEDVFEILTDGKSVDKLPSQIKAEKEKLSLIADPKDVNDTGVAVYLVNQTGKKVRFPAQDGHLYLMLEFQTNEGKWVRGEPHAYSWCGNSYDHSPLLLDRQFLVQRGYLPPKVQPDPTPRFIDLPTIDVSKNRSAKVRYRLYGNATDLVSNVIDGRVNDDDIRRAANDAMSVFHGDFEFVSKVATGEIILKNEMDHIADLQGSAISRLGDDDLFEATKAEVVLRRIASESSLRRDEAQSALKELRQRIEKKSPRE